jgi:hypothetical protein
LLIQHCCKCSIRCRIFRDDGLRIYDVQYSQGLCDVRHTLSERMHLAIGQLPKCERNRALADPVPGLFTVHRPGLRRLSNVERITTPGRPEGPGVRSGTQGSPETDLILEGHTRKLQHIGGELGLVNQGQLTIETSFSFCTHCLPINTIFQYDFLRAHGPVFWRHPSRWPFSSTH